MIAAMLLCAASAALGAITRLSIDLPEVLGTGFGSPNQRSVRLEIFQQGREVKAVLVNPTARNPSLSAWDARDVKSTLKWKGGSLEGDVEAVIAPAATGDSVAWKCVISAVWKKDDLVGRAGCFVGDTELASVEFTARPEKLAPMRTGDGFLEIFLPALDGEKSARAGITFKGGKAVSAAAFSPRVHPIWREIDASQLSLKSGRISGHLKLKAPADGGEKQDATAIELKADLRDGFSTLSGAAKGGAALLSPVPGWPEKAEVEIAFDAPLLEGERWRRRAVVRFKLDGVEVSDVLFLNGRHESGWSGIADGMGFVANAGTFEGDLEATVASATVQPGLYRIRFKARAVGPWLVGSFESELAGAGVAKGQLTGWYSPIAK